MNKNNEILIPYPNQNKASNPNTSIWLNASAGTGKTKVLIDRFLRLLLDDVPIQTIVCITYTKIAAKEMTQRLMNVLSNWSIAKDEDLKKQIYALTNTDVSQETIDKAKKLFSIILDNAHNIKIQTIHSFCQSILAKFPIEANIPTNFMVIEEFFANELKKRAIDFILNLKTEEKNLATEKSKDIQDILHTIVSNISYQNFEDKIGEILSYSNQLDEIINHYNIDNGYEDYKKELYNYLNANTQISYKTMHKNFFKENQEDVFFIKDLIIKLNNSNSTHKNLNNNLYNLLDKNDDFEEISKNYHLYKEVFLTKNNTPRAKILTKDQLNSLGKELEDKINLGLENIANKIIRFEEEYKNQISAQLNFAFMQLSIDIYKQYQDLKKQSSLLDFNDLILHTHKLLSNNEMKDWILYKLDNKINHILVDEAQDTSPIQWEIIKYFTQDFYSGQSAKENNRTIFIVGDIKQSIYSFQGADPYVFNSIKQYFSQKITDANKAWEEIPMNRSFRSASGVINAVNLLIEDLFDTSQPPYENQDLIHNVAPKNERLPYNVEIWSPNYDILEDKKSNRHRNLAQSIVNKIIDIHNNHNIAYKDILILYAKRENNAILKYIITLLKNNDIPVLGLDKINLIDNIAILDLIALTKFLLQNQDDFSLCCVLKSPLFNLSDEDIMYLKHHDAKQSIFKNLNQKKYLSIYNELLDLINSVDYISVFDLFFKILYTNGGLEKFTQRLGLEAIEPIGEFMNLILNNFNQNQSDNLQSFLNYIQQHNPVISRDNDSNQDSINLMTIHSSKGLESKVVFLLNDIYSKSQKTPNINIIHNKDRQNPLLFINPKKESKSSKIKDLIDKQQIKIQEESKRLFYVAITRAKEHLYICTSAKVPDDNNLTTKNIWHKNILQSLPKFKNGSNENLTLNLGFISKEYYYISNFTKQNKKINLNTQPIDDINLPNWYYQNAPIEPYPTKPISPSKLDFEEIQFLSPLEITKTKSNPKINKGIVIHKILEQLNYITHNHLDYAKQFLINHPLKLSDSDQNEILENIEKILKEPQLDFLFTAKSLNEVFISGMIEHENELQIISARVDKIIQTPNSIIIIDYKFAKAKKNLAPQYIKQMTLYKKVLANIYPQLEIKSYILFTQDIAFVEI